MSEQVASPEGERRTIAAKVSPDLKSRFDSVVQLTGGTVNEAGIEAIEDWIAKKLSDPELRDKAIAQLDTEERELQARRAQLQSLIGEGAVAAEHESRAPAKRSKS
jgi:hypothetical protein